MEPLIALAAAKKPSGLTRMLQSLALKKVLGHHPTKEVTLMINIGYGNIVSERRIIAIVTPDSSPIKRIIQEARDRGMLIDATCGRRTRSVIITDSDHIILSAVQTETVAGRTEAVNKDAEVTEEE